MVDHFILLGDATFLIDGKPAVKVQCKCCRTYMVIKKSRIKDRCDVCEEDFRMSLKRGRRE